MIKRVRRAFSKEFKNQLIDDALDTFGIERSLSEKGVPYDS